MKKTMTTLLTALGALFLTLNANANTATPPVAKKLSAAEQITNLFREDGRISKCYQYVNNLMVKEADNSMKEDEKYTYGCRSEAEKAFPPWNLLTVGWKMNPYDALYPTVEAPGYAGFSAWLNHNPNPSIYQFNDVHLRNVASTYWNNQQQSEEESGITNQCALREVAMGFDWTDAGLKRINGREPRLSDYDKIYFGADLKTTARNVKSYCPEKNIITNETLPGAHNFFSLDFIYDYIIPNPVPDPKNPEIVLVTNAIHLVVGNLNTKDQDPDSDILYQACTYHKSYKIYFCQTLVDASKWGINTISNVAESDFKNVNADFLYLVKNLEGRNYLKVPTDALPLRANPHTYARLRHLQFVNSVRSGDRYVAVKNPFAYGVRR